MTAAAASLPAKIPLREDSRLILIGFLLLFPRTAIYRIFAPDSVKEYTETQWTAELRRPRLIYIRDKYGCGEWWWFYLALQSASFIFSVSGLVVLAWAFLTNFWAALELAVNGLASDRFLSLAVRTPSGQRIVPSST